MRFSKVYGKKIDQKTIQECEDKLSSVFLHLGLNPTSTIVHGSNTKEFDGLTGDPLIFQLVIPFEHVLTRALPTAATDGRRFYWNPEFIKKHTLLGLRFVAAHEAFHAFLMHPDRIAGRIPKLWNIAVDYIVNGMVMDDLTHRGKNAGHVFEKYLGKYCTIDQYMSLIKNPFNPPKGLEGIVNKTKSFNSGVIMPDPTFSGDLTDEQEKEMARRQEYNGGFFFADPNMENDIKSPEKIYAMFYQMMPKCPQCGRIGMYKKPQNGNSGKNGKQSKQGSNGQKGQQGQQGQQNQNGQGQGQQDPNGQGQPGQGNQSGQGQGGSGGCDHGQGGHSCGHGNQQGQGSGQGQGQSDPNGQGQQGQGNGQGQGQCDENGCGTCGGDDYVDIFSFGDTLDEHMSTDEDKEKLAQRLASAVEQSRRQAGYIPAGLEGELNSLVKPQIKWQDAIKTKISRIKQGNARADWTRFKTRPLAYQTLIPKRRDYFIKFACLLDTSGSMSDDDIAYGVSQLQALDRTSEGYIVPADGEIYWDDAVEVKNCNEESLKKTKVVGRGGTAFMNFTNDYKKHFGDVDMLIIITDGFIYDMQGAEDPHIPVYWIITSDHADFNPPFGKTFLLRNGQNVAK